MILTGKVGDGQGLASRIDWGGGGLPHPLFTQLLGKIHPASLNVFVPGVHAYAPNAGNYPNAGYLAQQQGRQLFVRNCKVNGINGYILRCEHPGPSFPGKRPPPIPGPHTMFEIVASELLPGITYASDITLEFEDGPQHLRELRF